MKKLSLGITAAWQIAAIEAGSAKYQYIEKEHILIGILSLEKILSSNEIELTRQTRQALQYEYISIEKVLNATGLDLTVLRRQIRKNLGHGDYKHIEKVIHRSSSCKEIFNRAVILSITHEEINCMAVLAAILEKPGKIINNILDEKRVKPSELYTGVLAELESIMKYYKEPVEVNQIEHKVKPGISYLNRYGRDLTKEAQEGKLGPIIGRKKELLQLIQTLARRTKNNPVLVGEAGTGKTAIVEALAIRVIQGKDPEVLSNKIIIELNIGVLLAGTKYRGEFEERLTRIIEEVSTRPEIIIFIDEIHNLVGAGRAEGSIDAANILKPYLTKGSIRCIGATTIAEYRRYIESDSALERRFEKINVNEPSRDDTLEILKGIRPKWEEYHQVRISNKTLEAAVDLSLRFDNDHRLPDKAIDLVDKAAARTRIPILSMMQVKKMPKVKSVQRKEVLEVTDLTIAEVLSEKIDMPLEIITEQFEGMTRSRMLEMKTTIKKRLIGQDDAVERVSQRLLITHAGLGKRRGPMAIFLFLGPTGVGKTELAKLLADFLFGKESALIRLDMSEFTEEYSISKLIGSPPGYIGYEEEGPLTGKLRTKPYSVVLLDEIEKAHPKVFDLFLQVFDEGRLTDSKGRTADARNAIFIMTSNISVEKSNIDIGFGERENENARINLIKEVSKHFRKEFINRIDEIVVFRTLSEEDAKSILRQILHQVFENLTSKQNVKLQISLEAEMFLLKKGYSTQFGVRELHRTVERLVQVPLSNLILNGKIRKYKSWWLVLTNEGLSIMPEE